jgi:SAM-dependent methyltransferase
MADNVSPGVFAHSTRLDKCPACESNDVGHFRTSVDYHYQIPGEFSADKCRSCGLEYINPMPTAADLEALYPDDYYSYEVPTLPQGMKQVLKRLVGLKKRTYVPPFASPGRMLDIGCGAGQYLLEMRAAGWQVHGSELNRHGAAAGRQAGLDIRGGELMQAGYDSNSFDFIRSNHSFEHIPNPMPVLAEIRRLLKSDGKLFIGVPNVDGWMARLFGRYWWYVGLPVHTFGYNPSSITALLTRSGFRVEKVRYHSDYGGVLGSLQILANRKRLPRSSDGRIVRSMLLRLPAQYFARTLDLLGGGDCIEVIASLSPETRS